MNLNYLNDRITLSRIPITAIAEEMGLSRQSLYLKMKGERKFKSPEVVKLCEILRLTEEERMPIFFADRVDKIDTSETKKEGLTKMNDIIKVNYDNADRPTVSGRELHEALNIGTKYSDWFKRMCEYGFSEGEDYETCFSNLGSENQHGGQNKTDHELTLDMAKELCMIQRSEIGKRFREYFIGIEKAWNDPVLVMGRAYEAQKAVADKLNA